jgi:hypothetical protein
MNQRLNILASLGCVNSTRAVKAFMNIPKNPDYEHPPSGLSDYSLRYTFGSQKKLYLHVEHTLPRSNFAFSADKPACLKLLNF